MRMVRFVMAAAPLLALVVGCKSPSDRRAPYTGPTLRVYEVIDGVNQNNTRVKTIWSRGDFKAWIRDDNGKQHFIDGEMNLLYRKAFDLRLTGKKFGVGDLFDLGSNNDTYWLTVKHDVDTMWWGNYSKTPSAKIEQMPIRPDLLIDVLGIGDLFNDLNRPPAPVMRFNNDEDAYMFVWIVKLPDRWVAQKEVWYDRETLVPRLINLFDENGRVLLRAYLLDHEPLATEGLPRNEWPKVATRYDMVFPDSQTRLVFKLTDVRSENDKGFPKDVSFRFPGENSAAKVINLDEQNTP